MKTTIWKSIAAVTLAAALLLSACALGEARYPAAGGTVTDDANALSQTMTADIAAYADTLAAETELRVHIAMVLFLDGETVQTYADTLFTRWELGENDLLLLGAAAEDTFAAASGSAVKARLSDASLKNLLYTDGFSARFKAQQYDDAFGSFFVAFNHLVAKQYGTEIELGERFKAYQPNAVPTATVPPSTLQDNIADAASGLAEATSSLWASTMNAITNSVDQYNDDSRQRDENGGGLTPTGWIVLAIIVMIVLGQSRRGSGRRHSGCGCSPIGWILGGLGLGEWIRRNR